jgi:uncharacterized protein
MMSASLNLYRLQELDNHLDQINDRLNEIEKALSDDRQIRKARKVVEKTEEEVKKITIALHQIEDKVEDQRLKRKTTQASLFSGKIKNPKDLQDLQMESEALKRYIAQLEDKQLEIMITKEEDELELEQAKKELQQALGTTAEENASMLGEKTKLEEDLERFKKEKEAVLGAISQENLELYNRLRKLKRGTAVASITDGGCSVCGQALTPGDIQSVRSSTSLVFCPSCGRILFSN